MFSIHPYHKPGYEKCYFCKIARKSGAQALKIPSLTHRSSQNSRDPDKSLFDFAELQNIFMHTEN